MKVLMFGWEFPPHISGGLGTACYGLTKALLKQGIEVLFVVPKVYGDEDNNQIKLINASDVVVDFKNKYYEKFWNQLTFLEIDSTLLPYLDAEEYERIIQEEFVDNVVSEETILRKKYQFSGKYGPDLMSEVARYALVAAAIATKYNFDVIHAHDWLTYLAGIAVKKITGKPLVIHVHATEFDRSGENVNPSVFNIEKKGMENADLAITVSNWTRQIVIDRYGINPDKVITVHNGVEPVDYNKILDSKKHVKEKIVTFLGRVTFQKGPDYFVEVAQKVLKKVPDVRFVMAGSGDMLNKIIRRVAQLGIADRFHFTGFLKGDDVERMFLMSDVYVMPSVSEPFGISPLEAMRSNVPVIISKQSGVAEVLQHAIKVDFWDIDATADAIYGLLSYPALSKLFIRYGKEEVDNLRWDNAAFKIKEIYFSVLHCN